VKNPEVGHFVNVLRRRWLAAAIVCGLGIVLLPILRILIPPVHSATAELLIVSQTLKDTTLTNPDLPSIITSTEVLDRVIARLKLNTNPIALAKKIKTKSPAKASILELTYKDRDGARAAAIANTIADESSRYFHEVATRGYTEAIEALNRQIAESQAQISADDRLLQSKHAFASSDKVIDDLTSQIDTLRADWRQLSSSLAADEATVSALDKQRHDIDPIGRGEVLQKDVVYQQSEGELAKDVADLNSERASFHESFPGLAALARRVDRERSQLKSVAAATIKNGAGLSPSFTQTALDRAKAAGLVMADRERLRVVEAQLVAEQRHLQQVAGAGATVGTLRARREAALQRYLTLTQRLGTAQGDAAQAASLGTLVVVSRAVAGPLELGPWPALIGVLILALAICGAYLVDYVDGRLWGIREIEKVYGRPVLIEVGRNR
jgi:polysaccharide biosynthesis transport protein